LAHYSIVGKVACCYILAALGAFAQIPVVSGVTADGLSHSVVRLTFNVNQAYSNARVRYSTSTCTSGTGGTVQINQAADYFTAGMRIVVGGLTPSTAYQMCPEVTSDNVNWSSGVGISVTTLALPAIHPALPVAPYTFSTVYPNTTGYTSVTVASDCSDYQSDLNTAVAAQMSHGTIINIPTTAPCGSGLYTAPMAPDTLTFASTAVNTSNSEITIPSHGFSEGQEIMFGYNYSTFPASTSCIDGTGQAEAGLVSGEGFYAHVINANTIQVYCNNPSGAPVNTGVLMTFTTPGSGNLYVRPWNDPALNWVIVRTATPDAQFTPVGTRTGPAWISKMVVFTKPASQIGAGATSSVNVMMNIGANDNNVRYPVANIRFVGLEITVQPTADSSESSDPTPWTGLIFMQSEVQNVIFDRCYVHLPGNPTRVTTGWYWFGSNVAIVDSYFDNLMYWHPNYTGLALTNTSNTLTVAGGEYWLQPGNVQTLSTPVTFTLSGSGTVNLLGDVDYTGKVNLLLPSGITATCSGGPCAVGTLASNPTIGDCDVSQTGYPTDTAGNISVGPLFCAAITSGSVSSTVQTAVPLRSVYVTEGANFMIGGNGPGPYVYQDNYLEGAGLPWHHDDGPLDTRIRSDYYYYRDTFLTLTSHMFQTASSDGFYYAVRHPLEWKSGVRKLLNGIIFDGSTQEDTPLGDFVEFASDNGAGTSDLLLENCTFRHGPAGLWPPGVISSGEPVSEGPPPIRTKIYNNLFWDISPVYHSTCCNGDASGKGWILTDGGNGNEDMIVDHNTVAGNTGSLPSIWFMTDTLHEGMQFTNNFFYLTSGDWGFSLNTSPVTYPSCTNTDGKVTIDCVWTGGYRFDNNVLMSNGTQGAVQTVWPNTLFNYIPSTPSNYGATGFFHYVTPTEFVNGNVDHENFRLNSSGPYCSGCGSPASDGLDVGANIDQLEAAEGVVTLIGVPNSSITTTGATVVFIAPDSAGCSVDYSSTDSTLVNSFTRIADAGGARVRNIALTGLTTQTGYFYRVNCAVQQPVGAFRTN